MSREMTNKEAISNLNQLIYGIVSPDIQRSLDLAIKALEERPQDCSDCKRYDFPYFEVKFDKEQLQELVDKTKAEVLASIELGEWIPVSERLPEKKGYFLTSTVFNDVYCDFWNGEEFERTEMILAWMPLPEPYKKGGAR